MPALGINPFLHSKHLLSHSKTLISSQFQTSTGQYVEGVYFLSWVRSSKMSSQNVGS